MSDLIKEGEEKEISEMIKNKTSNAKNKDKPKNSPKILGTSNANKLVETLGDMKKGTANTIASTARTQFTDTRVITYEFLESTDASKIEDTYNGYLVAFDNTTHNLVKKLEKGLNPIGVIDDTRKYNRDEPFKVNVIENPGKVWIRIFGDIPKLGDILEVDFENAGGKMQKSKFYSDGNIQNEDPVVEEPKEPKEAKYLLGQCISDPIKVANGSSSYNAVLVKLNITPILQ